MRKIVFAILTLVLTADATAAPKADIEVRRFRFGKHKKFDFERLVIQFNGNRVDPNVRVSPHPSKQEASVLLDNVQLAGAIPESAINDSYVSRSSYLGPISINTDDPSHAVALRVFLKENTLRFDAFWESNPPRLVVDAFPPSSPRASKGRHVLKQAPRKPASVKDPSSRVICFPASTQLAPLVSFIERDDKGLTPPPNNSQPGPIVCFPLDAEVKATVNYLPASRVPQSQAAPQLQGYQAPQITPPPPTKPAAGPPQLPQSSLPPLPRPPRAPNASGEDQLENTGGKGSRVNAGGFTAVTPLGSKLGAGGPVVPKVDPSKLLPIPGAR